MSKNVERTINATLTARELPGGTWQLSSGGQGGVDIILRGTDPQARADRPAFARARRWSHGTGTGTATAPP